MLGPASATGDDIAVYNATTGKLLKDGGATIAQVRDRSTHTGTQSADTLTDGTTNKAFLATERTKLTGIATAATANSPDATLLARANHTGTQAASTVTGLATIATSGSASDLGAGTVPIARVPTGTSGTTVPFGNDARFSDARTPTTHVHAAGDITSGVIDLSRLGTTPAATEYLKSGGATGSADWVPPSVTDNHLALTKTDVGLGNVDNTSDVNAPVSTAQQTAINAQMPTGTVVMWSTATAPPGWLLCNGTNYTYAAQPALAAVIGVIYGGVAGTNFNVPDMRMRLPIGHNPASTTSNYNTVGGNEGSLPDNSNGGREENGWQHTHQHDPNLPTADLNQTTNTNTTTAAGGAARVVSLSGTVLGNHAYGGGLTTAAGVVAARPRTCRCTPT